MKKADKKASLRLVVIGMAAASALAGQRTMAATDIWTSNTAGATGTATANQLWLNTNNWSGGIPGVSDIAQFNSSGSSAAVPNSNTAYLDFADASNGNISIGAISDVIPATISKPNLLLSGQTLGTLVLNGATVTVPVPGGTETYSNTILASTDSSASSKNLTTDSNVNIALPNATNNILEFPNSGQSGTANSGFPTISINGNIRNAGSTAAGLTFLGAGTAALNGGELFLGGTNTFTGGITVGNSSATAGQTGELVPNTPAALPTTGTITINEGSQLFLTNNSTGGLTYSAPGQTLVLNGIGFYKNISGALRVGAGVAATNTPSYWEGNIQLGTSALTDGDAGYVLISVATSAKNVPALFQVDGNFTGGGLLEQGSGTLVLNGTNNTYTGGTQIGNGGILVTARSSLGTGDLELFQTSTNSPIITLNNANQTVANLISAYTTATASPIANGYVQDISLNGTALTVTEPANTAFGYGAQAIQTSGISDAPGGSPGSLIYNSTSNHTLTLTGQNSFSGGTTINHGTLDLANNVPGVSVGSALGTGPVTVNSGGILASGNYTVAANFVSSVTSPTAVTGGTFTGALNVSSGGIVSPGGSNIGFLNTGPVNAAVGSIFDFTIASALAGNYSTLNSTGAVNFNTSGTETVNIAGSALAVGTYNLITGSSISSNASGGGVVLGSTPAGRNRTYVLSETGTQVVLTIANTGTERDWSLGGGSPAVDGPGTWQSGSTNFVQTQGTTTTTGVAYDNTATSDTNFGNGGNGGAISLGSNVTVGGVFTLGPLASGQSYTFASAAGTSNAITTVGGVSASNSTTINAPMVLAGSQTWSADSNITLKVAGNISESTPSQLTKSGNGTLVLTGTGSWSGGTTVSQGTLQNTTAAVPVTGGIANSAVVDFDQTTAGTYAGVISGTGSVVVSNVAGTGSPTVTLSGSNTYTGSTTLTGGTLAVNNVSNLGTGDGGIILSGGTLQATANLLFPLNSAALPTQKRTLTLTANTTSTVDTQGNTVEFDSNIKGAGNLVKVGSGTLVLEGIPSTTNIGALISSAGTIQIAQPLNGASFIFSGTPSSSPTLLESGKIEVTGPTLVRLDGGDFGGGGSFQIDPSSIQVIGYGLSNTSIENSIVLNPGGITSFGFNIGADTGSTLAINGPITSTGAVPVAVDFTGGAGIVTLGGTSTYLGTTKIDSSNGGVIQLTTNNALPATTDVSVTSSGNFDLNGFNQSIASLNTGSTSSIVQNTNATNNSILTITGSASTTYQGIIEDQTGGGTLGLTLNNGIGSLALPTPELYSGPVTVLSGRLDITGISTTDNTTGLGATGSITIGSLSSPAATTAQLRFNGVAGPVDGNGNVTIANISFNTVNHPTSSPFYPTITLNALGGYNSGSGSPSTGAIRVSGNSDIGLADPIVFAASSVISVTDTSSLTLSGPISGTGTFISQGSGLITLTGTNTGYSGGTEIDAGTVTVANSSSLGTGALAVNNTLNTGNGSTGLPVVLNLNNTAQSVGSLSGTIAAPATGANTATINLASGTVLTINQTVSNTYAGAINGSGGSIVKTGSASLTLAGGVNYTGTTTVTAGTLTFGAGSGAGIQTVSSGGINVSAGTLALAAASSHTSRTLLTTSSLSIGGPIGAYTGTLDLGNNDLDIQNAGGAALVTVAGQITHGFKSGAWTGTGITSSAAAADSNHLTALGVILNNDGSGHPLFGTGTTLGTFDGTSPSVTDVLVKFTYYGDTNLDGKIDGSDYSRIDNGFLTHATGWYNGDFNYDNVVDGSDYTLIDNAFNSQGSQLTTNTAELAVTSAQITTATSSAVPEPTTLVPLALLAAGQLGRRRRVASR